MYLMAKGLVKTNIPNETAKNTATCKSHPPPSEDTKIATSAPIANHIVVSPTVTISITINIIIAASQIIAFINLVLLSFCYNHITAYFAFRQCFLRE